MKYTVVGFYSDNNQRYVDVYTHCNSPEEAARGAIAFGVDQIVAVFAGSQEDCLPGDFLFDGTNLGEVSP
jgi:hypothetical protein